MREGIPSDAFFDAPRGIPCESLDAETQEKTLFAMEVRTSKEIEERGGGSLS